MSVWLNNPGYLPPLAAGRRVKVRLFNGKIYGDKPVSDTAKVGWEAGGEGTRGGCNWQISNPPHPYEIEQYWVL